MNPVTYAAKTAVPAGSFTWLRGSAVFTAVALTVFAPVLFGGRTMYPTDITNELFLPFAAGRRERPCR